MLGPPASQLHGARDVQPAGGESGPPSATERDTDSVAAPGSVLPDSRDPRRCCPIPGCGKVLSRVDNVARHLDSVHRRKTAFPCTYRGCQRAFARHDYLTSHQKVHRSTTSRMFACMLHFRGTKTCLRRSQEPNTLPLSILWQSSLQCSLCHSAHQRHPPS
ncbi:hypothetical protein FA95DRAFT_1504856 [Auriscalpium vulgare]|uniref:Uncharacterized protein n=1 Tax=Auriscalpium vulgare TaxID=40419 RepID=A0ACB8R5Q1_9AGAM|nr:hypothetical protein FA95DRAFT_1504856 [Auriscalpium vulgare]